HVVQHPAGARFHAKLVNAIAQHVVGITHDDSLLERAGRQVVDGQFALVAHSALVSFNVEVDTGGEVVLATVEVVVSTDNSVACDGQKGATERIEVCHGGRVGVRCSSLGGVTLVRSHDAADA